MNPQKVLQRTPSAAKTEKDWFYFSSGLMTSLCSDYMSIRLLYYLERLTTAHTILIKMIEVVEKSLKLFVSVHSKTETALSDSKTLYGHSVEKLRLESCKYALVFDDPDICEFTSDLNDRGGTLYQYLRYGSQETTDGMSANLDYLLPIVDKIFFSSLLLLPQAERKLLNFTSSLKNVLMNSQFDQTLNKELVRTAILLNNPHADRYVDYCHQIDKEHQQLLDEFARLKQNGS